MEGRQQVGIMKSSGTPDFLTATWVLDEDNENESSEEVVGAPGERLLGVITVSIGCGSND